MKLTSIDDLRTVAEGCEHALVLFTGDLDSTYTLKILSEHRCKVTALSIDLGGGFSKDDLNDITHFFDANLKLMNCQTTFAEQALIPAIKAQAESSDMYPISSSLARPILAKIAVNYAKSIGCDAIIHSSCSIDSLSQLNNSIELLGYSGFYGSPYESPSFSREQKKDKLDRMGLILGVSAELSCSSNLWCRKYKLNQTRGSDGFYVSEGVFHWSKTAKSIETEPGAVSITFSAGIPTHVNGQAMKLVDLIACVNEQVGEYGIGRFAAYEFSGQQETLIEVCEAPAAIAILLAYKHLETNLLGAEVRERKQTIEKAWINEARDGRWYGVLKGALESFIDFAAENVNGTVSFTLHGGTLNISSIVCDDVVVT